MNNLTLVITVNDDGNVVVNCPDIDKSVVSYDLDTGLSDIKELLDDYFFKTYSENPSEFVCHLYGLYYEEHYNNWKEIIFKHQFKAAFIENYPKAANYDWQQLNMVIPGIKWDVVKKEDEIRQNQAYQGFILEGHSNSNWIDFVNWIADYTITTILERWVHIGLPLKDHCETCANAICTICNNCSVHNPSCGACYWSPKVKP